MRPLLAVTLLCLCPPPAPAQTYTWRMEPGAQWAGLFKGAVQVGGFDFPKGQYFRLLPGDRWEKAEAPAELPRLCAPDLVAAGETATPGPKGVVSSMLSGRERLEVGGEEVDAGAYFGESPKAGAAPYILVAGDDAFLASARALFADGGRYAPLKAQWVVGFFPASGWPCRGVGYRQAGVYFLGPADEHGRAKCYSFQAAPDLEGLDTAAASTLKRIGLRDPDPGFRPEQVPDLRRDNPLPPGPDGGPFLPWGAGLALAGVVGNYLWQRLKNKAVSA